MHEGIAHAESIGQVIEYRKIREVKPRTEDNWNYLRELAERIRLVPTKLGVGRRDVNRLIKIADDMEQFAGVYKITPAGRAALKAARKKLGI